MKYTARKLKTNVNVTPTSPLREFFVLTGALAVIAIGAYFLLGLAVDLLVPYLPLTVEDKLARVFFNALDDKEADAGHKRYVQNLVDELEARCTDLPYEFQVHVFQSSTANAHPARKPVGPPSHHRWPEPAPASRAVSRRVPDRGSSV